MNFIFDYDRPIYVQLIWWFKLYIISGKIKSGERLASVRDLAMELKVNPNTLQRALSELEEMGLIYTERTNGKFVTDDNELINKYRKEYVNEKINQYFKDMEDIGIDRDTAIKYLKEVDK